MDLIRFLTFKGRISRIDYICILSYLCFSVAFFGLYYFFSNSMVLKIIFFIYTFAFIVVPVFITVQRLHDIGLSGTHYFYILMPFYNIKVILPLLLRKGIDGPNEYGEDPLALSIESANA